MEIIGLVGFIGSGKGSVSSRLVEQYGFRQDSFAASLKDSCAVIFDWPRHLLEGDTELSRQWRDTPDEWWGNKLGIENFTPRLALQLMGTDVLRNHFHKDIWFLTLSNRLRKNTSAPTVISDVRFPNEINFIKDMGGLIIEINRFEKPHWYNIALEANNGNSSQRARMFDDSELKKVHYSEWAWVGCETDYTINNIQDIPFLENEIHQMMQNIK